MRKLLFTLVFLLILPLFVHAQERTIFEEPFDEKLKDGWSWLREVPGDWRLGDKALEIKMEPMPEGNRVRNILYRNPPKKEEGPFTVSVEVDVLQPYSNQYQQAGLYWMQGNELRHKFVMEMIDGELYVFPGKLPIESEHVVLRWRVDDTKIIAEYQPKATGEFRKAYEFTLPSRNDETDRIALQCWHGPANTESWTKFMNFKFTKPEQRPTSLGRE